MLLCALHTTRGAAIGHSHTTPQDQSGKNPPKSRSLAYCIRAEGNVTNPLLLSLWGQLLWAGINTPVVFLIFFLKNFLLHFSIFKIQIIKLLYVDIPVGEGYCFRGLPMGPGGTIQLILTVGQNGIVFDLVQ